MTKPTLKISLVALTSLAGALAANAADTFISGSLKHEFFAGADRTQVENGTASPTMLEYVSSFEFIDVSDNYARRVSGFFIPPTTGNYVFFVCSDDDSDLFLSTDDTSANKRLIAQETAWSGALAWTSSPGGSDLTKKRSDQFKPAGSATAPFAGGIPLTAGKRYYIEGVHHEGGGGDNFAATYKLVSDDNPADGTDSLLTGSVIGVNSPTTPTIVTQPFSKRVPAGSTVTFVSAADPPSSQLQWYRNGTAISGATTSSYTTDPLTASDNGAIYTMKATAGGTTVTSAEGKITIGQLVQLPGLIKRERWDNGPLRPDVEDPGFDASTTPPDITDSYPTFETPTNAADNYTERASGLFVPSITGKYVFFIASDDDSDLFLSTDSNPSNKRLIAQEAGWSGVRNWTGANGPGSLTADQAVAQKRSDKFISDPANDPTAAPPFKDGISLTAGTKYYIEAVHHEGGGGDNLAVTYKLTGEPDPVAGDAPRITAFQLAAYTSGLDGGMITITTPPQNSTVVQNRTALLSITATSGYIGDTSGAQAGLAYQWQTAPAGSSTFTNVPGALSSTYTTPLLGLSDNGRQYRVSMMAADLTTNSAAATITVTPDTTAPLPAVINSVNAAFKVVTVTFNELMDKASAETGANYSFAPGNVAGASASLAADGKTLTITTASALTPNTENTLTVTGAKDMAGNAVAANTTIKFTFNPVTYAANIQFDKPLGFYRFEETSGSVAKNDGTTGGDAAYYVGDEGTPGDGGTPSQAKGEAGPRPPTFAGFDVSNRAASFDSATQDWVDTKNQFLQNRAAFTLEYWVKPANRATDAATFGNRVGIVGQNDAIEYGFVDPNTIQIWTPGGGSLNTAYSFPDNEWHHVATIADGTALKTYYDGTLAGNAPTTTGNYGSSTFNVHIGGAGVFDVTGNYFTGQIDEVAIFDKAIPADRVAAHFKAGKEGGVITTSGAVTPSGGGNTGGSVTLAVSGTGATRTLSWSPAGGTLQSTPAFTGSTTVWTDVGTANPATINVGTGSRFYRIKQ